MTTLVLLAVLAQSPSAVASARADVDRLIRAAEPLTSTWPVQPPPPIPEVALVMRHGRAVTPLLVVLLPDEPEPQRESNWRVQQQATLALSRIYAEPPQCGRVYCDGDPAERIRNIKAGWLRKIADDAEIRSLPVAEVVDRFRGEEVFWRQFEIARTLADKADAAVSAALLPWLTLEDRHRRGNAAFVLARVGDRRGFDAIAQMLDDRSPRPEGQGVASAKWSAAAQIRADRYHAAHLLGDLEDVRGVGVLIPLLEEDDLGPVASWSLGQIGDRAAVDPLLRMLERDSPSSRVHAIAALAQLNAPEALPRLPALLEDHRQTNFGNAITVAQAAQRAIATISSPVLRPAGRR